MYGPATLANCSSPLCSVPSVGLGREHRSVYAHMGWACGPDVDSPRLLDSPIIPFPHPPRSPSVATTFGVALFIQGVGAQDPGVHTLAWLGSGWRVGACVCVCATGQDCVLQVHELPKFSQHSPPSGVVSGVSTGASTFELFKRSPILWQWRGCE